MTLQGGSAACSDSALSSFSYKIVSLDYGPSFPLQTNIVSPRTVGGNTYFQACVRVLHKTIFLLAKVEE